MYVDHKLTTKPSAWDETKRIFQAVWAFKQANIITEVQAMDSDSDSLQNVFLDRKS